MPTPADVATVERLYAAVAAKDFATVAACFSDEVVWHLPGRSAIAGTHRGWAAIRDNFMARLDPLSGGTFRADLLDIAVGAEYIVAVQHATAQRDQRRLDITGCQLMRVQDGKIVEVRGHYSDEAALDAFWAD